MNYEFYCFVILRSFNEYILKKTHFEQTNNTYLNFHQWTNIIHQLFVLIKINENRIKTILHASNSLVPIIIIFYLHTGYFIKLYKRLFEML